MIWDTNLTTQTYSESSGSRLGEGFLNSIAETLAALL